MIPAPLRTLPIQIAIVCAPGGSALAESLETLLREEKAFRFSRFEYDRSRGQAARRVLAILTSSWPPSVL
jgi:hypothetical protein